MPKRTKRIIVRNPYATHAKGRKAGPMKHKNEPKGGAKNRRNELLDEMATVSETPVEEECSLCSYGICSKHIRNTSPFPILDEEHFDFGETPDDRLDDVLAQEGFKREEAFRMYKFGQLREGSVLQSEIESYLWLKGLGILAYDSKQDEFLKSLKHTLQLFYRLGDM